MKKRQLDHILRAVGRITREKEFIVIGGQSLHASYPDLPDALLQSAEADLIARGDATRTEWLNAIGQDSEFHVQFGYYADPVEEGTAILPSGWKQRLVELPPGDTEGVKGLCLEPHDLAIANYVAGREKDRDFNRGLVRRGLLGRERLLQLLEVTDVQEVVRARVRADIANDFHVSDDGC
jgi:hypothetical protein